MLEFRRFEALGIGGPDPRLVSGLSDPDRGRTIS